YIPTAGEGCFLFLVAHFKRGRLNLDRLIAILRKTLHRIGHTGYRALRTGTTGNHRERHSGRTDAKRDPPKPGAARPDHSHEHHFEIADLLDPGRVLAAWAGTGGGAGSGAAGCDSGGGSFSMFITAGH